MKDISIKVLLLLLASALVGGGVMYSMKTLAEPPVPPKVQVDYAYQIVDDALDELEWKGRDLKALERQWLIVQDLIQRLCLDKHCQDSEATIERLSSLYQSYGQRVIDMAFEVANSSNWFTKDLKKYQPYVTRLERATTWEDGKLLSDYNQDIARDLQEYDNLIGALNQGWALVTTTYFKDIDATKIALENCRKLKQHHRLRNCQDLMAKASTYRERCGEAHYIYLSKLVGRLSGYSNLSYGAYKELLTDVREAIGEYEENGESLYGNRYDTTDLYASVKLYSDNASRYYFSYLPYNVFE